MRKKALIMLTIILFITLPTNIHTVHGSESSLSYTPLKDAYVDEQYPGENYGSSTVLKVGYLAVDLGGGSFAYYEYRTFIAFDISEVQYANVTSAILKLYCSQNVSSTRTYRVQRINESWTEFEISWNNQPSVDSPFVEETAPTQEGWWTVNVTSIFQNGLSTIGFRIIDVSGESNETSYFVSKEGATSQRPVLELNFTFTAKYTFRGAYFENNGTYAGSITVTGYYTNESNVSFTVDGDETRYFNNRPLLFTFELSGGGYRYWYVRFNSENITIFVPSSSYSVYEFTLRDYAGVLTGSDEYVETLKFINGSQWIIERRDASDVVNTIPFVMEVGTAYIMRLITPEYEYRFGWYIAGVSAEDVLPIFSFTFSSQTILTYKYVRVEAYRSKNNTLITVNYQDTLKQTNSVTLEIKFKNGTVAYSDSSTSYQVQFQWNNADNETDYIAYVTINHAKFGTLTYSKPLPYQPSLNQPFDLSILGKFPVGEGKNILPAAIILCVAAVFSTLSAGAGIVITVLMAALLRYLGWIDLDWSLITLAASLAIMYAITEAKRRLKR